MKGEGECGGAEDKDRAGKGDKGGASIAAIQREITLILLIIILQFHIPSTKCW